MNNSALHLIFLTLFLSNLNPSSSVDTIYSNSSLSGDRTIVSDKGNFVLGFFSPPNTTSFYIGIWYRLTLVSTQTVIWVANRDRPVTDKSTSNLIIRGNNLLLLDPSQTPLWSTNRDPNSTDVGPLEAILTDTGNLVLRNSLSKTMVWQSYDYPTHTWLPGSKIGLDKRTGRNQLLTSWKNSEDPSPGLFSLELDPNGSSQYFVIWNRTMKYWTSGPWNGRIFSLVPEMTVNYIYNFSYVSNANENYFIYSVYDSSIISRFIMDESGQIKQETWLNTTQQWNLFWSQPRQQCEVYDFCGRYGVCSENSQTVCDCLKGFQVQSDKDWSLGDHSGGCVRNTPLQCGKDSDGFVELSNMKFPDGPQTVDSRLTSGECESSCLGNCTCSAYAYESSDGCLVWNGEFVNLQRLSQGDANGKTIYIRLAKSELQADNGSDRVTFGIVAGLILGGMAFVGVILSLFLVRRHGKLVVLAKPVEGTLVAFGYKELQGATKNFSERLGGGGFGSVFKGTLPDSNFIAVKKLESVSQGEKQFRTEVSTIGTIQHVNLVRLRGFCSEGIKKLLVYDYMPNGSLDAHLFQGKGGLDWRTRYRIAVGTARGLVYLHEKCRDCIIHCDIKPENILLDADMCPKVADFGLAKLVGRDFSRVLTTLRGTRGYLAPEWISGVAITAKADVYSFGMMLFEFVSGRRNSEVVAAVKHQKTHNFFPNWVASHLAEGRDVMELLDAGLEGDADVDEVIKVCKVACWCIQDDEADRPLMSHVVQMLEGILEVSLAPIPRSLQVFVDNNERIVFFTGSSSSSSQSLKMRKDSSLASFGTTTSAASSTE